MNVVTRSLMAAGLLVYAAIHFSQAASPPDGAPTWLRIMFFLTAGVAVVLAGGLFFRPPGDNELWKDAAAALALASAVALLLSQTTGFIGVDESDLRSSTFGVLVAESMVLISWVVGRVVGHRFDEVDA